MIKVLIGKDNYLFLDNDSNKVLLQITGKKPLSDKMKAAIKTTFDFRRNYAKCLDFRYLWLIPPNTHCINAEHLPDGVKISDERSAIYLQNNFPDVVLYPLELLRQHRDKYAVCYKTDTHWTGIGAALTFNEVSDRLGLNTKIDVDNIPKIEKEFVGDLGIKLSPRKTCTYQALDWESDVELLSDNHMATTGRFLHLRSKNRNGKRCVIFGASSIGLYGNWKIIGHYFYETFFFWTARCFDRQVINDLRPDVVINEVNERFFNGTFTTIPYIDTLTDKILSKGTPEELEKIDLSDEFFSDSIRTLLSNHKKHLVNQKLEQQARENEKLKKTLANLKDKQFEETKRLLERNLERPIICCQAHLSKIGWMEDKLEGEIAGVPTSSRAIEALKIYFSQPFCKLECAARTKKDGWLDAVGENKLVGSVGRSNPLLGVKINLDEQSRQSYDIIYRIHSATGGGGGMERAVC